MCGTETKRVMITKGRDSGTTGTNLSDKTPSIPDTEILLISQTDLPDPSFLKDKLTQMACQREPNGFCVPGKNNGTHTWTRGPSYHAFYPQDQLSQLPDNREGLRGLKI